MEQPMTWKQCALVLALLALVLAAVALRAPI
jgi:hypothetical protein